jgi:hypothetical protein
MHSTPVWDCSRKKADAEFASARLEFNSYASKTRSLEHQIHVSLSG